MKILSLTQTVCQPTDAVFRPTSVLSAAVATCIFAILASAAGCSLIVAHEKRIGPFVLPLTIVLLVLLWAVWRGARAWLAARRPTNWLMRVRGNEVLIKFRD